MIYQVTPYFWVFRIDNFIIFYDFFLRTKGNRSRGVFITIRGNDIAGIARYKANCSHSLLISQLKFFEILTQQGARGVFVVNCGQSRAL